MSRYKLPAIYITENGAAFDDRLQGKAVHDRKPQELPEGSRRPPSFRPKTKACRFRVISSGLCWIILNGRSAIRNASGSFTSTIETQERVVKDSGWWYGKLARTGSLPSD